MMQASRFMRSGVTSEHWLRSSVHARARLSVPMQGSVASMSLREASQCAAWQRREPRGSAGIFACPAACPGAAFTLVEMLVVLAIILILTGLAVPAYNALNGAGNVTRSVYNISGVLDQARAYAMANNTYVYIGIGEVDSSVASSTSPQSPATTTAGGRVAVAVVASRDGTRGYDVNDPATSWNASYASGANLVAINKLLLIENLHLADFGATPPDKGNMDRPAIPDPPAGGGWPNYRLGNSASISSTPFAWPLGYPLTDNKAQYLFSKVINVDPQGVARMQGTGNADSIPGCVEIGLQPTHGNSVPAPPADQSSGNQAALQMDALTGAVRIYRP